MLTRVKRRQHGIGVEIVEYVALDLAGVDLRSELQGDCAVVAAPRIAPIRTNRTAPRWLHGFDAAQHFGRTGTP